MGGAETGSSRAGSGLFEGSGGRSFEIEECFLAMVVTANTCWKEGSWLKKETSFFNTCWLFVLTYGDMTCE